MFAKYFSSLNAAKKVAYIGLFLALSVVANTVLDLDITPQNKITFTYLVMFLSAYMLGALPALFLGFAGDGLGYLIMPDGNYWFYGLTLGLMGFAAGVIFHCLPIRGRRAPLIKAAIAFVVCYVLFTVCLNTVVNYTYALVFLWSGAVNKSLWMYLVGYLPPRLAIQTAVFAGNAALFLALLPLAERLMHTWGRKKGGHFSDGGEDPRPTDGEIS